MAVREETLFYGGRILTMTKEREVQALLVRDGKIAAAGRREEVRAQIKQAADVKEINLDGAALLPGFVDSHSHFSQVASSFLQVSLDGMGTTEEMGRAIGRYRKEAGVAPGGWIVARDYDNNLFAGAKNPPLSELDAICPDHPLIIQHKSGHMGLLNSLALSALGITEKTQAPEGGRIETRDGALTGYLEENAFIDCLKRLPPTDENAMFSACEKAQRLYASYGITTIQDGMAVKEMIPFYRALMEKNLLQCDLVAYFGLDAGGQARRDLAGAWEGYTSHFRIGGFKMFLDGSPQGRTAWMRKPYEGEKEYCGYGTMTDEAVLEAFETAAREKRQILAHCNGDGAAEQYLSCLERAEREFPQLSCLRPVLIHGQLLGPDQVSRAVSLGVIASFFIAHIWYWGDVHIRNFGMERASRISPAGTARRLGLPFTLHQDSPVIRPDMMETVWCAVNRMTRAGVTLSAQERLGVEEALRAVTRTAAFQYFEEGEKGTLEAGKRADLTVLERDPLTADPDSLRSIRVVATYKDGREIYASR